MDWVTRRLSVGRSIVLEEVVSLLLFVLDACSVVVDEKEMLFLFLFDK